MVNIAPKWTQASPRMQIHPHKAHKKLRHGTAKVGRHTIEAPWLRADGWMTKRPGKPPYRFLHRKNVDFHSSKKHGQKGKGSGKGVMSQAAKKAWATRRKRHH